MITDRQLAALEKYHKNFKYVPLRDADHCFDTFNCHH
jgi:hypothetical protein